MVDRTRIFWFGRTEPEPELKSPNPNRTRTEPVSNKIGTFTKVKQFFAGFSSKKLNGQASKAVINGCNKGNKYFLMWRFPISSEILGQFRHLLVENRIYAVSGLVRISDVVRPNRLFGTVCTHMCRLHMTECWLTAIQFRFLAAFAVFWFSNSFCHSPWVTNEQLHCSQE